MKFPTLNAVLIVDIMVIVIVVVVSVHWYAELKLGSRDLKWGVGRVPE